MQTLIIIIHLMIVIALVVVVLLQRSEGGALGIGGGGFMSGRAQANALTRATAILAGLFFVTSVGLALLAHTRGSAPSLFDTGTHTTVPATPAKPQVPSSGGILPTLQHPGDSGAGTAPKQAPPTTPATPPPAPQGQTTAPAAPAAPAGPQVPTSW